MPSSLELQQQHVRRKQREEQTEDNDSPRRRTPNNVGMSVPALLHSELLYPHTPSLSDHPSHSSTYAVGRRTTPQPEPSARSLGQHRRREREHNEARVNGQAAHTRTRSIGQRRRRERERDEGRVVARTTTSQEPVLPGTYHIFL
jgi:hypothetical protein